MRKKAILVLTAIMLFGSIGSNIIHRDYESTNKSISKSIKSLNYSYVDPDTDGHD